MKTFYSFYLNTLTHGVPSGECTEDKKAVRMKIAGGNMAEVLENKYLHESL